ncbi:pantoate--beta-alanine ligase [Lipingzhangella sp. LS1_29]|uniref:Pantothenate synthetase n=1 Tax=Lipingzhangella rawalii TaxID=2055835 RepID=A0ABU2HAR8_9ACTN|nr:pantoate--beta-alanine ligase [Lipingzhangella rawalii]MDS1271925.1 pantoate--beta-alanine ligase [Lipingzhangella rawalii]
MSDTPTSTHAPRLVRTGEELDQLRPDLDAVVLVPTMGALHTGHRSLIRQAREHAGPSGTVVVSIFVNPLQFGPNEDYAEYPRTLDADLEVCANEGVDVVFAPSVDTMYPDGPGGAMVTVRPGPTGTILEGATRPGFFDGVLTVVAKLFHLVRPDAAVFGQKDAQQLALVRRMVRDLSMPVAIHAADIVRDRDGLATSSRNVYLSPEERDTALALSRALRAGRDLAARAATATAVRDAADSVLASAAKATPPLELDYLVLVDPDTFTDVDTDHHGPAVLAVAAWVGETRLIDNMPLHIE